MAAATVAVLLGTLVLTGCGQRSVSCVDSLCPPGTGTVDVGTRPADAGQLAPARPVTDLPSMAVAQLPQEGIDTLRLIQSKGPFPYDKDGVTFSNREGLLPAHPSGWYHEYTVSTPGSPDRGARRIITGKDGSRFYTSDHYASFREVVSGVSA